MAIIKIFRIPYIVLLFVCLQSGITHSLHLSHLHKNEKLADFRVMSLYRGLDGKIQAIKMRHLPTGAPIFVLEIETVPQLLTCVDTPATSNRGIPHSLEHLLAVKGTKGRYFNLLREMRLSLSGAATYPDHVCYGFSSGAGIHGFFEQFHALLEALYRPDFTDVEAEREFYHFAVAGNDKADKTLVETGTVYDEMLSTQKRYTYNYELYKRVLGEHSPFAFISGGTPDEMRLVTPAEIRSFHDKYYRIGPHTDFIFAFPPHEKLTDLVERISSELRQFSRPTGPPPRVNDGPKYPINSSDNLEPAIYPYPATTETSPSFIHFAWKPARARSLEELKLLELFASALGGGQDSPLHRVLIDSKERVIETGATGVDSFLFLNNSCYFPFVITEISGIPGNQLTIDSLKILRALIVTKIREISQLHDQSKELIDFNRLVASYAQNQRRSDRVWIHDAPGFGNGIPKIEWKLYFEKLESDPSFVKSLSTDGVWQSIDGQLRTGKNIWRNLVERFHLLETPYATATAPSPKLLEQLETQRRERVKAKIVELMDKYHTGEQQEAISHFEKAERFKTEEIDAIAATIPRVRFTDHPPMTPDDQLRYKRFDIDNVPVIAALFERPPTFEIGVAFDLRSVPRRYYKYLSLIPRCLDSLGLKMQGRVIPYSDLVTRIQREIFGLSTGYEVSPVARRTDLTIRASAVGLGEFRRALDIIHQLMESTNLDISNLGRLRDIVARRISENRLYSRQDVSTLNAAYSFRYRDDPLFFSLNSRFSSAHWDERLAWLLHAPVDPADIDRLETFANNFLARTELRSRHQLSEDLTALKAQGLERELADYWKNNLASFPESELINGLQQLTAEVVEDLRTGPARTVDDLKDMLKIIFNKNALHLSLTLSASSLANVEPDLADFLKSIPRFPLDNQSELRLNTSNSPIGSKLEKRYGMDKKEAPWYLGFANPDRTTGDAIFYTDFPSYAEVDVKSLERVLASKLFSGGGPHSFYIKGSATGLAYNSFVTSDPSFRLAWYYANRSPDIASLIRLVNSTVSAASDLDDSYVVDHVLSRTFSFSRSADTFAERGKAATQDIRDGNEPEKIRRFSEAILKLRRRQNLSQELVRELPDAIGGVLVDEKYAEQQHNGRSQFFFVGSEQILSDIERRLAIPRLLRLWPSDFWIN